MTTTRVTVPVEPTEAMLTAAWDSMPSGSIDADTRGVWSAMLSAAPAPEGGAVMRAEDAPVWADGIVTDGERVSMAQKAEADHGGTYWAVDGGDGGLDWEPTHFVSLSVLATREEAPACKKCGDKGYTEYEGGEGEGYPSRPEIEACSCSEEAPAEAGEIDLYDDKVQAGIAWTMRQWGETLGLKTWTMGDGSESVEGDVGAEIHTILVDAGLRDPETNEMAALRAQPPAREDALRAKGEELVKALKRYGFPVSGAATVNLGAFGSSEAMAVDFTTREFIQALAALQAEQKGGA